MIRLNGWRYPSISRSPRETNSDMPQSSVRQERRDAKRPAALLELSKNVRARACIFGGPALESGREHSVAENLETQLR